MAMTGVLQADFSAFTAAAAKAEASLNGMEGGALKTESALSNMSKGADQPLNTFRSSVGQVDQALAASGLNIGKYARGFAEISEMAGKTVGELGLLAAGAGVVAAAMAGWNFGRAIAGWFDLDTAIGNATAKLLGWGDVAAQTAGAKADVLALASKNAGRAITDMGEAMRINAEAVTAATIKNTDWSATLAIAQAKVRSLSDAQIADIEIMQRAGATKDQINAKYQTNALSLKLLADRQKLAGEMAEGHTSALKRQQAEVAKLDAAYDKLMSDVKNANQLAIMEADATNMAAVALQKKNDAASKWIAQQVAVTKGKTDEAAATAALLAEQNALNAATDALGQSHTEAGAAAVSATAQSAAGYSMLGQQVNITGEAIRAMMELSKFAAASNAILQENSLFTSRSQLERISQIKTPGSSPTVQNTFNIVDTEANIARRVSESVTRSLMQAGAV